MSEERKHHHFSSDTDRLQKVKEEITDQILNREIKVKVGDLVKIIELQNKLFTGPDAEEKFWEMIEKIRQEELKDE
jgi:hypothetical protein